MIPVPGYPAGMPYGRRGRYWGCHRNAQGGIHTGIDYPAPTGTPVVAARPGIVNYCNHGAAFGRHQLEIVAGDGTRDFYAHMSTRLVANGKHVRVGQRIGRVGAEGNVTGPHLHFERHGVATGPWSCGVVRDPAPSIRWRAAPSQRTFRCGAWNLRVGKVRPRRVRKLLRREKLDLLLTCETHPRAPQLAKKLRSTVWRVRMSSKRRADKSARDSTVIVRKSLPAGRGHVIRLEHKGWERKPGRRGLHPPRSAMVCRVAGVWYISVHLPPGPHNNRYPLRRAAHQRSLVTLLEQARRWNEMRLPWVMAGDWNMKPSDPRAKAFAKACGATLTGNGIDWVASRGVSVMTYQRLDFAGSDHRPIVFTVRKRG